MNPFREVLEGWTENEWIKGAYYVIDGRRSCLLGRLFRTCANYQDIDSVGRIARELFPDRIPWNHVPTFNDHKDTTFEDVVQVLEKAAVRWDEQQ